MSLLSITRSQSHDRKTRLQPVDGAAGRTLRASVHRPGLRAQRLQPADDQAARHHAIGARTTGSSPSSAGSSRIAMVFLGGSAAVFGRWVEEGGPRRAMFTAGAVLGRRLLPLRDRRLHPHAVADLSSATACSAAAALGIGYISPVSTLIKWFPDRPGMATGMAIMGFGGGAFIASPLSVWLMSKFTHRDPCRRRRDLHHPRLRLLLLHDRRLDHRARAGAGLEAGGLRRADAVDRS